MARRALSLLMSDGMATEYLTACNAEILAAFDEAAIHERPQPEES